ncbi:MAG: ferric reductase-like transmembrane domain-containing protein [Chloroflexi bacterium]|nr:ferric reductase-like transmembrane domain-containing protein [Chloroflexota bacterium]
MSRRNIIIASIWVVAGIAMLIAGQSQTIPWDLSRAAGFVSYLLLATSTALGLATSSLLFRRYVPQGEVINLHIFTSYLLIVATVVHVAALKFDDYINYSFSDLLMPLASSYRPVATAMGIVSAYLVILVVGSFFAKRRIGTVRWRWLHYLSFPAFAMGLVHGVMAGSDSGNPYAIAMYLVTGAGIFYLVMARVLIPRKEAPAARRPVPATPPAA